MKEKDIIILLLEELKRAETKHPRWPKDIVHQSAIVAEESGELTQACLDLYYKKVSQKNIKHVIEEAVQVGAMAIRLLKNL